MTLLTPVAAIMADKPTEFCTYTQVKIDAELTPRIRAAVSKLSLVSEESGKGRVRVQEFISDLVNAETARILGMKAIKRRTPPPPPKGTGRPPKKA